MLVACSASPATTTPTPVATTVIAEPAVPPSLRPVKIGHASSATVFAGLWAAKELGIFEKYGLRPDDLVLVSGGPVVVQSLVAGELDAAYLAFSPAVAAIMGGAPLKVLAGIGRGFSFQLFTKPAVGIERPEDTKGKRVGISRLGSESHIVVRFWARAHGLQEDDLTYVAVGDAGQRIPALESGAADIVLLDPPFAVKAENLGYRRLADLTREPFPWQQDGVAMLEQRVHEEPELSQAIVQAVVEGAYVLRADPVQAMRILRKYMDEEDPAALQGAYEAYVRTWIDHARPDPAGVAAVQGFTEQSVPGTAQQPESRFVDTSVLDKLEREGFFSRLEQQYPAPRLP
jgi:NitT/TauT family transport system substrate-binding protein